MAKKVQATGRSARGGADDAKRQKLIYRRRLRGALDAAKFDSMTVKEQREALRSALVEIWDMLEG